MTDQIFVTRNDDVIKVHRRGSFSEVHNAIFGSMRLLEKTKNIFLFLLVKDTEVFYGICVMNQELLKVR